MCKLLLIPHVPAGKSKEAWRLARAITPAMTRGDDDGFGYAAITTELNEKGQEHMLMEKWLFPKDAWSNGVPAEFEGLESALQGGLDSVTYQHAGLPLSHDGKRPGVKALMLHSRFSTCGGGVENSHPFILEDKDGPWAALVHNGVVNTMGLRMEQSTCDSEALLNKLRDEHVAYVVEALQTALDAIKGYYAFGAMWLTYEDGWVMDVVKDSTAQLSAVFVHELGAIVYATSADQVEGACKKLKWRRPRIAKMRNNTRVRYSVNTGKVLIIDHFKPAQYEHVSWQKAHAAGDYSNYSQAWTSKDEEDMERAWAMSKARAGLPPPKSSTLDDGRNSGNASQALLTMTRSKIDEYEKGKLGSLTSEASDVQEALMEMEARERASDNGLDAYDTLTINPLTGAIELPDGTIVIPADVPTQADDEMQDFEIDAVKV